MAPASFEQILWYSCAVVFARIPLVVLRLSWRCHGGCESVACVYHSACVEVRDNLSGLVLSHCVHHSTVWRLETTYGAGSPLLLFGFWDCNLDFQAWPQARSPLSQLTDSCFSFKICGISSSIELKWYALEVLIQCLLQINDIHWVSLQWAKG